MENKENIYLNVPRILSYNSLWIYIIGERGVGKSYGFKDAMIRNFLKRKRKFMWLRRFWSDLESAVGSHEKKKFFEQLSNKYDVNRFDISSDDKLYYLSIDSKIMGYATSLRHAESIKGTSFDDVDYIIFDEFLVGDGGSRYLKDEVSFVLSIYETVARFRNVKFIFLGNATSVYNPYFQYFGIKINPNKEFQTFKNGLIMVNYVKNEPYRELKKATKFGQLIKGTKYEDYAINNKFINDSDDFIRPRDKHSTLFFNIKVNSHLYGVWIYKENLYISERYNQTNKVTVAIDINNHDKHTILLKKSSVHIKNIINHFKVNRLYFDNQFIKHEMIEIFSKMGIY